VLCRVKWPWNHLHHGMVDRMLSGSPFELVSGAAMKHSPPSLFSEVCYSCTSLVCKGVGVYRENNGPKIV
jgi:hypothetical protein